MSFQSISACLALSLAALVALPSPAVAADNKIVSSAICQAMSPAGAQHLQHNGSSLEAVGSDVTVVCPILRDNLSGDMLWVDVRHYRPGGSGGGQVSGSVYSCGSTFGGCSVASQSTAGNNAYTSVFITTSGLPSGDDRYFYYRSVLPEGWKIVSMEYKEQ
jgi:hypothetical protein